MTDAGIQRFAGRAGRVPILRARRLAAHLVQDNDELSREVARLRDVIARHALDDALAKTIALDDLAAEQTVQESRLSQLLDDIRRAERQLQAALRLRDLALDGDSVRGGRGESRVKVR